jgi:hypothetical protein
MNKFDEVFAKKGRSEKADVTKQNVEYTPTINTHVNIIKNKLPTVFAKKGRFEEADVATLNAEYTPTINTLVNIDTRNIKNTVKNKPWSALYGSAPLGSQLLSSGHKDLPTPATVEEREYEEHGEFDVLQEEPKNIEDFVAEMSALEHL